MRPKFSNFDEFAAFMNHSAVSALRNGPRDGFADESKKGAEGAAERSGVEGRRRFAWDDPSLYFLALLVGLVPIVAVLLRGGAWGAEPTLGTILCVLAVGGLLRHAVEWVLRRG